jgi:hypothetical protein
MKPMTRDSMGKRRRGSADLGAEAREGEGDHKEGHGEQREQDVGHAGIIA